jgi:inhibitor of KinA sporulation pathway (predicted exonuclease)
VTYIIVDFEATCSDDDQVPREEMEIIEIGAVALRGNGPHTISEFQSFIKPVRHTELTAFCKQLTGITQQKVDSADTFDVVIERFSTWLASFENPTFCSWGDYDKHQLRQDCTYHDVAFPFGDVHINIKTRFADNMSMRKPCGLEQALRKVGIEFMGQPHRGIDDARNMANLSPYLFF